MPDIDTIKELRERTGLSFAEIKKALDEADGDTDKAMAVLQERGVAIAEKKSSRSADQGVVEAYIHSNRKIGAVVVLNCETDFVAKNEEFINLAHEIAMQIASMNPKDSEELLAQSYIKDPNVTIKDLINQAVAKLGENIRVSNFSRFQL